MATKSCPYASSAVDEVRRASILKAMRVELGRHGTPDVPEGFAALLAPPPTGAEVARMKSALQLACKNTPAAIAYLVAQAQPVCGAQQVTEAERACSERLRDSLRMAQERRDRAIVQRDEAITLKCHCSGGVAVPHDMFVRGEENKKGAKAAVNRFKRCQLCGTETVL